MIREQLTARRLAKSVADVVEGLELRRPAVVTRALLAGLLAETGSLLGPDAAAERLVREGWLLSLRTRDAWEFVPAARAGRYSSGDPWIELRAVLAHRPDAPVAVAFESAVWELGHGLHQPEVPVLAHRRGWRPPVALDLMRSATYDWRLPTWQKDGLPVWRAATVAVAAAHRPDVQGDWANADHWLSEVLRATTPDDVLAEAEGRGTATLARLGHLAEWSGRHDIADRVEELLPGPLPVSYLGPRRRGGRWVNRWRLYDALLPRR
ncbi:MAG: hypothetical protein KY395_05400 [Actinobacteria bacterium]|nr:hypothetical protein [Actinomycetota bacterium]